jgi:hypothetical protein
MLVDTVLGQLTVADPPPALPAEAAMLWAQAVQIAASDMTSIVARLPDRLRPAARVLGRAWVGDARNRDALRACELQDLPALARWQVMLPDVTECDANKLAEVQAQAGDAARAATGRMLKIAELLSAGRLPEARLRLQRAAAARSGSSGAPLASVGAWRAHTGLVLGSDVLDSKSAVVEVD